MVYSRGLPDASLVMRSSTSRDVLGETSSRSLIFLGGCSQLTRNSEPIGSCANFSRSILYTGVDSTSAELMWLPMVYGRQTRATACGMPRET